jgi:DNA sulfur modification protein DndB
MLENIFEHGDLLGLARQKFKNHDIKAVHPADLEKSQSEGWEFYKKLKSTCQVKKEKAHGVVLEDRVWRLFYKMQFDHISGFNGAKLLISPKENPNLKSQIDIVAIDQEVAIAIECKSSLEYKKRPQFQEELGKFQKIKDNFIKTVRNQYPGVKKQFIFIICTNKILLSENDKERAKQDNVLLIDENDLTYYENLVNHLGPAAKYQILSDMLPGKEIPGLSIRIPAIKTKMGGHNCYTLSISPEYLLKVSYVSHRSKGKQSDINTYQRMLSKTRLKKIQEYITEDGVFPTNIILNFEKGRLNFQKIKQESETIEDLDVGVLGWLDIKPAYKSAWVIDGQHRLFAYSGHEKALKSKLSVLAFEGLQPSKQAELFIDINAKQKSVKPSLLQELFAELHWDSSDISVRISAIISKAIQDLNSDPECRLFNRIQATDGVKDQLRCITLTSLFGQIEKKGFFVVKEKNGTVTEYGPLWGGEENNDTLKRTKKILKLWLNTVADLNKSWWNIGSAEGGGLSMNDGISSLIALLRSVFDVLEKRNLRLVNLEDNELCELIQPYATIAGEYLASLDEGQRKAFRDLRGAAGVNYRTRQLQLNVRKQKPDFTPDGLDEWINLQKQQTNKNAKDLIDEIETFMQDYIVAELKEQFGLVDDLWWYEGVPNGIRTKVTMRMEEDKNKRGGKEYYFDLLDYKKIIHDNWELLESVFGYGKGGKDKRTEWLDFVNENRRTVAHASSGKTVSIEDFLKIEEYHSWLKTNLQITSSSYTS